jgi:transposase-like protein
MMLNSCGIRDIDRVLKVSKDTVYAVFKNAGREALLFDKSEWYRA